MNTIGWRETTLIAAISLALLGIGAGVAEAQWNHSTRFMEQKQLGDLFSGIQCIAASAEAKRKIAKADKELCGRGFFEYCFKNSVLDKDEFLKKCVSLRSLAGDEPSDGKFIDDEKGALPQSACSYATPKMGQLMATLNLRGKHKAVALCFDSRNWLNGGKAGVLVSWTDGDMATYLDAKTLMGEHNISAEDLGDPGGKVLGKLAPFKWVFEEQASADAAAKVREDIKKLPSFVEVFKKKGRSWKYKGTPPKGADPKKSPIKEFLAQVKVADVSGSIATLNFTFTDEQGNAIEGQKSEHTENLDLSDDLDQRPPGKAAEADEEIEIAGKKWKCRLWTFVDVGDVTVKNWMSVDYPGLVVKSEGHVTVELIEFTEPK
ncbi:MAG: hypothetical protein IT462_16240 [Planctomycetes bacterium]|nr:hypothetical protein [Planctomycetota bacterium]